jgi:transcriptional regulator with XRE-family HTH domain
MKTLKEIREEKGVTQLEVAFGIGVTPATVANWETGRSEPKARHLRALAEFLGVSMEAIDFGELEVKSAA